MPVLPPTPDPHLTNLPILPAGHIWVGFVYAAFVIAVFCFLAIKANEPDHKPVAIAPQYVLRDGDYIESLSHWDTGEIDVEDVVVALPLVVNSRGTLDTELAHWRVVRDEDTGGPRVTVSLREQPIGKDLPYTDIADLATHDKELRRAVLRKRAELAHA